MLSAVGWKKNQPNTILFVLVDGDGAEVAGLGSTFTLQLSKAGAAFANSAGTKAEVGSGWYSYISTSSEANTSGPIAVKVTGAGIAQQNLEYVVEDRVVTAVPFTYTVTSTAGSVPIANAVVSVYTDVLGTQIVWTGFTDALGVARDEFGNIPRLEPGTYYFWRSKFGFAFDNPDTEVVS